MLLSLTENELFQYTRYQLNQLFFDGSLVETEDLNKYIDDTIYRLTVCFREIKKPYYYENKKSIFNHLHGDHYAMFLYLLSNTIWEVDKNETLASKVFLLNKTLHGIDAFYAIKLPEFFLFVHPLGTVLGNATYSNYFVVYQNCSVGATEDLIYPTFEGEVTLFSKSTVIGDCHIGANTILGANSFIINTHIKKNSIVINSYPNHRVLKNDKNIIDRMFR
jgi:serine O-acetyltransferase